MKTNIKLLIAVSAIVFGFYGCSDKVETKKDENHNEHRNFVKLSAEAIKEINIETEMVSLQPFTGYLIIPAKVITNQDNEAQIGSLVQGRVHKVYVKVGDYVKAGQVLMTIEGLDVGEIKAAYLSAKASLDYAESNYKRLKKLFDEKIGSQKALSESQAEYEKALAEFNAEDKKIHSVGLSDEDVIDGEKNEEHKSGTLPIKSSINGIVVERNVVIGQLVDATTNAFKIINTKNVWIDGEIYEKDLAKINQKTNALFLSSTYPNEKFNGKIIYIGQIVNELTRTITIRGEFDNPNNKLKPQMFGELKIPVDSKSKTILVPEEAVVKEAGEQYVFVQTNSTPKNNGEQTFEKRIVITGVSVDNRIEIKDGLKEGEKVVSKGAFYLKSELKKDEIAGDEH